MLLKGWVKTSYSSWAVVSNITLFFKLLFLKHFIRFYIYIFIYTFNRKIQHFIYTFANNTKMCYS